MQHSEQEVASGVVVEEDILHDDIDAHLAVDARAAIVVDAVHMHRPHSRRIDSSQVRVVDIYERMRLRDEGVGDDEEGVVHAYAVRLRCWKRKVVVDFGIADSSSAFSPKFARLAMENICFEPHIPIPHFAVVGPVFLSALVILVRCRLTTNHSPSSLHSPLQD